MEERILAFCARPHSKREIIVMLGLKDFQWATKKYIVPLVRQGLLRMTIPDKPTSRNQQYVSVQQKGGAGDGLYR